MPTFTPPSPAPRPVLVFDACNVGVVLRAVLFVQAVVATAAMFSADSLWQWLHDMAWLTGASLPGTLIWLVCACLLRHRLQRLPERGQYAAGLLLGALAGLYACAMLQLAGGTGLPWLASATSGALLASLLVAGLVLRARGHMPANTQARLAELQSRIRPHFLFNTLNSAIALVRAEPAKAESLLEDLSDLFRYALAEPHSTATLAEEIELAQRYLAIEQVRFGDRMRVQWQLDAGVHHALLPPLLLQPLVENAIRHGVEPSARGGKLQVRTRRRGQQAEVYITNSLPAAAGALPPGTPGTPGAPERPRGHGMALANVRARLSLLHDLQASFQAGTHNGHFVVRITLPLAQAQARPAAADRKTGDHKRHAHPDR